MYDPIRRKKDCEEDDSEAVNDDVLYNLESDGNEPWEDEDDRVANFYITTN